MFTQRNPNDSPSPVGPLSWGLDLGKPRRLVFISGQVGAGPDGRVGEDFMEQCRLAWRNVDNILRDSGMTSANIVKTGIFVSSQVVMTEALKAEFNALRIAFLGDHRPSSTMIFVPALMDPSWLIEIDAIAAE